jgi:glutamyl-tRNA reductase
MTTTHEPRVSALVAAAPDVDADRRVRIAATAQERLSTSPGVLLTTCHRVEWLGDHEAAPGIDGMLPLAGIEAASHVIQLALGLASAVVGEDQILHQLRAAVADARRERQLGHDLDLLLDHALRAGRRGRSWRPTTGASLADLALDRVEQAVGGLAGRAVLIVGTGTMGGLVARGATPRGAHLLIASRTPAHAADIAAGLAGAAAVPFDPGPAVVDATDVVVVALAGSWSVEPATALAVAGKALVVDLSMPSAVDVALVEALGDRFVGIDDLGRGSPPTAAVERYTKRLEVLAAATLDAYLAEIMERHRSRADRLADRVERQRSEALAAYLRRRPDLDDPTRRELEDLARALTDHLFREPLTRLASDPEGRRAAALDELFGS